MIAQKDFQFLKSPLNKQQAIELINKLRGGSASGNVEAVTQDFEDLDGEEGLIIAHNLGYKPIAQLFLISDDEGGDLESSLIDQHISVNAFRVNWVGIKSGSVTYYK